MTSVQLMLIFVAILVISHAMRSQLSRLEALEARLKKVEDRGVH